MNGERRGVRPGQRIGLQLQETQFSEKMTVEEIEEVLQQVQQRYTGFAPDRIVAEFSSEQVNDCAY